MKTNNSNVVRKGPGRPPKLERNLKIVEMYDNPDGKYQRYTFRSLANVFQISERQLIGIYHQTKKHIEQQAQAS